MAKKELTFTRKELKRLKELFPKAKHYIYIKLPEEKEVSFMVNKGASLARGMSDQINHIKKEGNYSDDDLQIESYDLREVK